MEKIIAGCSEKLTIVPFFGTYTSLKNINLTAIPWLSRISVDMSLVQKRSFEFAYRKFVKSNLCHKNHVTVAAKFFFSGLNDACEFKHGQGYGEIVFKNGDKFCGEYIKGRRNGRGKLIFVEGETTFHKNPYCAF